MVEAVPILTYHHVNPRPGDMVTVTPEHFEAQMAFLAGAGYQTLFIGELLDWMAEKTILEQKAVVLTFDDGYQDNVRFAYPILKKYVLRATIFLVTGWSGEVREEEDRERIYSHRECRELSESGKAGRMALTWPEARQLEEEGLVRVESHTHQHQKICMRIRRPCGRACAFPRRPCRATWGKKVLAFAGPGAAIMPPAWRRPGNSASPPAAPRSGD
jgi:peptidoglycan/xylan/chitin deacetylase (PgdA/CDA1 family)